MKARDNPFSSTRMHRLSYRDPDLPMAAIMARLKTAQFRGAIVGCEGSGKTTLLTEIGDQMAQSGFTTITFHLDSRMQKIPGGQLRAQCRPLSPHHAILLDGAEQMPWAHWHHFRFRVRKAGALVITSHRSGLLPDLVRTRTTPELLAELITELLGEAHGLPSPSIDRLFHHHGGNIRAALRQLYDIWAADGERFPAP